MDARRKRKKLLGWLPAAILTFAIVAVAATAGTLISNGLGDPVPAPTRGQVTDLNWSIFTKDGLAYIDQTREIRVDLARLPAPSAAIGMADNEAITIGPKDNGDLVLDYYLIVNGGAPGKGGDKFTVSQLSIQTAGGVVSSIRASLSDVLNFRKTLAMLTAKAALFGWDTSGTPAIYDTVEQATRDGKPYTFTFGPGVAVGVPIFATASCDTDGYCVVEYVVAPPVR